MPGAKRPDPDAPKPPPAEEAPAEPVSDGTVGPRYVADVLADGFEKATDDVNEGVQLFVQKPLEGAIKDGPVGLVTGMGEGTLRLANGVYRGSFGLLTSTVEGVRSTPDELQRWMEDIDENGLPSSPSKEPILATSLTNEPQHIGEGVVTGVKSLGAGILDGVVGLAVKPFEGARDDGFEGFVQGVGQGVANAGTKPVGGFLDLISSVTMGLRNTPEAIAHTTVNAVNEASQPSASSQPPASSHSPRRSESRNATNDVGDPSTDPEPHGLEPSLEDETEDKPEHVVDGILQGLGKTLHGASQGVKSFLTKPGEGAAEEGASGFVRGVGEGTWDLANGVYRGSLDLVSCTVEGVRNTPEALADLPRWVTEGGSRPDTDADPILATRVTSEPTDVVEGFCVGAQTFGQCVMEGAVDLTVKPIAGAKEDGAWGFVKGVGEGLGSVVVKPVGGFLDFAGSVAVGLRNTPETIKKSTEDSMSKASEDRRRDSSGNVQQLASGSTAGSSDNEPASDDRGGYVFF